MIKSFKPGSNIFQQKVPIWLLLVFAGAVAVVILSFNNTLQKTTPAFVGAAVAAQQINCNTEIRQQRLKESRFTSRLLFIDIDQESEKLSGLKSSVESIIEQQKREGRINSASVYMKKCGNGEWISVNPDEDFSPGSVLKVGVMITILKMSEKMPGFLDKDCFFKYADASIPKQAIEDKTLVPGRTYKVREMLYYMIAYSDNYATNYLSNLMDVDAFKKLYSDIGIEAYDVKDMRRKLKASDVGKLFRLLYNSSYLNDANSEYALSILSESSFRGGLVKGLPAGVTIAHKFGEASSLEEKQLHDAGIVYAGNSPYLLIVMTRGNVLEDLSQSIGEISKQVYDYMNPKAIN